MRGGRNSVPFCIDGKKRKRVQNHNGLAAGQNNVVVSWTILQLLTYHTMQHGKSDPDMRTCLCLNSMIGNIQERCRIERNVHQQLKCLQKANENDNDHFDENCDQNLRGKVGIIGKSTGRRHHLHLQQSGLNHNKENGKIGNCGKSGKYNLSEPSTLFARILHIRRFFFFKNIAYTHQRMSCMRRVVKTAHLVHVTQTVVHT